MRAMAKLRRMASTTSVTATCLASAVPVPDTDVWRYLDVRWQTENTVDKRNTAPYEFIRIAVMLGTSFCLGLICAYFVISAFNAGYANGIRSTAGILLPLVLGGFLAVFNRELFEKFSAVPVVPAFVIALLFGVVVMTLIRNVDPSRIAPFAEMIVTSGLTALLYAPGAFPGFMNATDSDRWLAYYFGIVSGKLGYVVFMRFPFERAAG